MALKSIIQRLIAIVQKIFIMVSLFILYICGFGITLIFVMLFNRRLIRRQKLNKDSFWIDAQGYGNGLNESLRES